MKKLFALLALGSTLAVTPALPAMASAQLVCTSRFVSASGVRAYSVCLAEGGLPTSGTNPALVGE